MKQFTIDLDSIDGIHGGIIYIYYLARMLSEHGMPCKVKHNEFPRWFDNSYEKYMAHSMEGLPIIPECSYRGDPNAVPLIQNPFIPCDLSKAKVSIGISSYICGNKYPNKTLYIPVFIYWDKCKDIRPKIPGSLATSRVTSGKPTIAVPNVKADVIITELHQQFMERLKETESFIHTATHAGLEGPIIEAMACGCVVFYADTKGSTGHVREGVTGYQIASETEFMSKYASRDLKVGERARKFMFDYYSDIACAEEVCKVFSMAHDIVMGSK
jgi:hypothetical protein